MFLHSFLNDRGGGLKVVLSETIAFVNTYVIFVCCCSIRALSWKLVNYAGLPSLDLFMEQCETGEVWKCAWKKRCLSSYRGTRRVE